MPTVAARGWRTAALVACVSCSIAFPVDDYEGPPRPIATSDAATDADGARSEAGELDAATGCPDDAGADYFCDDFDRGELGASWSSRFVSGGTLGLDGDAAASAPYSLAAKHGSGSAPHAYLFKDLFGPRGRISCDLDLLVIDAQAAVSPLEIVLDGGPSGFDNYLLILTVDRNKTRLTEYAELVDGGSFANHGDFAALPFGRFVHVGVEVTAPPSGEGSIVIAFDGVRQYSRPLASPRQNNGQGVSVGLKRGSLPAEARADNVVCRRAEN